MAEITQKPGVGDPAFTSAPVDTSISSGNVLKTLTNASGAVVSLALVVGIGIWGYKLLERDVSGIPVVRAVSGEMRVRPEEPGGELARHQGLSVNVVAAEGAAGRPADELRLAPRPVDLTEEDQVIPAVMVATAPQEVIEKPAAPDIAAALQSGNVDDLVAQLTEGVAPLTELEDEPEKVVAAVAETVAQEVRVAAAAPTGPGLHLSLRPKKRPARQIAATPAVATPVAVNLDVDPDSLPAGTRLAQLGAFDSEEVAREQWDALNSRFSAYLMGKKRVVQKAQSGGRVFYRLRAMGFEDIADARRFCSALVAENADCIPVVTR